MAKTKDILAKLWARRNSDSVLIRDIFHGRIVEYLPTEQPCISNLQADMLVRNDQGEIHHVEFQATHEADFAFRMLKYLVYFRDEHRQPIHQCVFYIGHEPMRLEPVFEELGTTHRLRIVNLQEYDSAHLLASPEWADNLWALGARGEPPLVLDEILMRLAGLRGEEQKSAFAALTAYSCILKLDELLNLKLKEHPMLDINFEDSAVIRPLMEKAARRGRQEQLLDQLGEKFGALPTAASERVHRATPEELDRWARRFVRANSLEETFE